MIIVGLLAGAVSFGALWFVLSLVWAFVLETVRSGACCCSSVRRVLYGFGVPILHEIVWKVLHFTTERLADAGATGYRFQPSARTR